MEQFLKSIERRALRMAQVATGNTEDALDIVQDSMLRLVRRYSDKPSDEWRLLFFRILQNSIRDWGRRRSVRSRWMVWLTGFRDKEPEEQQDPIAALADPSGRTPAEQAVVTGAIAELDTALCKLPLRQQQAFLLRAWEGMSVAETALTMECSEGTVKTLYSRAVHTLRDMLKEHWP